MCGFAGIIALGAAPIDLSGIAAMTGALAHRGPDGEGFWTSDDGRIAFGHRRLAIIDLDAEAAQPMRTADGTLTVVYNGEIYNHQQLRAQLVAAGQAFSTRAADTEVLLEGYRAWGIDGLLARLQGIFSFALHDAGDGITHLVRDPIGIKPFYVAWRGEGAATALLVGSEMRAILACPEFAMRPNLAAALQYLTFMAVPAPYTIVDGLYKIPAGHRMEIANGGTVRLLRYDDPAGRPRQPAPAGFDHAKSAVRTQLERVVRDQMIADVSVAVMLSGGIDSSAILALASRSHGPLDAYTLAFTDAPELNETKAAVATAKRCKARHHVLSLAPETALAHLDDVIAAQDEPQADWVCVPLWFLSREVAQRGGKVVLVGEGADELFAGYDHWRLYLDRIGRLARWVGRLGQAGALAAQWTARFAHDDLGLLTRLDFFDRAARRQEMFWGGAVLAWPTIVNRLWRGPAHQPAPPRWLWDSPSPAGGAISTSEALVKGWFADIDRSRSDVSQLDRMIAVEFRQRLPELLLMRVDKMSMAHGVEARVPFLDRGFIDHAMAIPAAMKLSGPLPKWLLREAVADLVPDDLRLQPKIGFGAPVERWLREPWGEVAEAEIRDGPLAGLLNEVLVERAFREHRAATHNHAGLLWALFVLSRWFALQVRRPA